MRESEGDSTRARIAPLYWSRRSPSAGYSLLFPLWHRRWDASRRELGLVGYLPFTLIHSARDDEAWTSSQRWLVWTREVSPSGRSLRVPPLFAASSRASGALHRSALGYPDYLNLFERRLDPDRGLSEWHALTVWSKESPGDRYRHYWPFYGFREREGSVERSTLWPLFRRRAGPEGELELHAPWPLVALHRRGAERSARALPLFASRSDAAGWERPPIIELAMASPVPLWYRASGHEHDYRRFLWLYWHVERPGSRRRVVGPWYSLEEGTDRRHFGLFPLYHGSRWASGAFDAALPGLVSYRARGSAATVLPPLYWRFSSPSSTTTALVPLYFDRSSAGDRLSVVFPVYYRFSSAAADTRYWFPLYGSVSRGGVTRRRFLLFPLYSRAKDEELGLSALDIAWPILHLEKSSDTASTRVLPLYWSRNAPSGRFRLLFPLYWESEAGDTRHRYVPPLLYGDFEREGVLRVRAAGPLWWRIERPGMAYRRDDVLLSLYSRTLSDQEVREHLFPFYWRKSGPAASYRRFPPLGGWESSDDGERSRFLLGFTPTLSLFEFRRSPFEGERVDRALLYYRKDSHASSASAFVPLYFRWRDAEEKALVLFPIWSQHEDLARGEWRRAVLGLWGGFSLAEFSGDVKGGRSARVLLFYDREEDGERFTFFAPLYWRLASSGYSWSQLFPLFAARREDSEGERSVGVLGVTPRWSLLRWARDREETRSGLWPLYGSSRRADGGSSTFYALGFHPKIAAFTRERDGDSLDVRVLFRLLRWRRSADGSALEVNPLFYRTREGGTRYWAVLGGLFGVETRPDGGRSYTWLWRQP